MTERRDAEKVIDLHPHDGRGGSAAGPGALRSAWLPDGIRARLFLLIGLTLLPVLALQGWIYYEHYQWRQNQALRMELEVAEGIARTFQTYIDGIRRQLDTVGETILTFSPYTQTKAEHLLAVVVRRYPAMRTVNWVSPEGVILASNVSRGIGHDLSGRPYFQQIVAGRTWALGDLTPQGAFTPDPTVAMGVAFRNAGGELLGVVVVSFEPTRLEEVPFTPPHDADSTWTLFDSQGRLVFRNPEIPLTWERRIGWLQNDPLLQKALQGQVGLGKMKPVLEGGMRFVARVPIGATGWAAGASRQVSVVATAVRHSLFHEVGLGLLVTLLAFVLAYLIARTLAGPLYRLEHDAQALGAGSFELSADPQAPAEVRSLRGTVARMARDLIERAEAIRLSAAILSQAGKMANLGAWQIEFSNRENLRENPLRWSDEAYRIFGLSAGTPITYDTFLSMVHPADRARVDGQWLAALQGEAYDVEHRIVVGDVIKWVRERAELEFDGRGVLVRAFGAVQDITEPKKAEEALRRSEESLRELTRTLEMKVSQRTQQLEYRARQLQKLTLELSQAEDRERKRLAEILHDDLQQQLAAAKFHLGLLFTRARRDESLRLAVARLDGMLKDAIETSRGLSHELSPALLYYDDLGATLEWLAGRIHAKHGLVVHVHADGEVDSKSDALKAFLYKAAQEMLFNVVKHARVGQAAMRIRRAGQCLCLVVSDRGRGFDPQDLKAATGFGLFSIRERVQLLGGRMKIKSARDKGCTLFLAVPDSEPLAGSIAAVAAGPPADVEVALPGAAEPGPPKRLRVLVADDHEVVRNGLSALLAGEPDIEIVGEAANGREAVDLAYELEPDIVIMDVSMPVIGGDEATRQIKLHLHHTRVIALSMYEEAGIVEKMHRAGAEAYVCKTAPSDELLAAVRNRPPGPAVEQPDETKASSPA